MSVHLTPRPELLSHSHVDLSNKHQIGVILNHRHPDLNSPRERELARSYGNGHNRPGETFRLTLHHLLCLVCILLAEHHNDEGELVISADPLLHVVLQECSESSIDDDQRQEYVHSPDFRGDGGQGDGGREVVLKAHHLELDILLVVSAHQFQAQNELLAGRWDEPGVAVHDLSYSVPLPLPATAKLRLQQLHKVIHLGLKRRLEDVAGGDGRSVIEHILTEVAPVCELKLARRIRGGGRRGGVSLQEEAGSSQPRSLPGGRLRELELTPGGDKARREKMVGQIATQLRQVPSQVKQVIV